MSEPSKNTRRSGAGRLRAIIPRPVKVALRGLASVPARIGHAGRRRRAQRRLATEAGTVRNVLVMCTGNICRSPYVALQLDKHVNGSGLKIAVASAGFLRSDRPSPVEARQAARRRGLDLDRHLSRRIEPAELAAADLILVMERGHARRLAELAPAATDRILLLGDLDPAPLQTWDVPDPWGHPPETFDRCYERLDRCVAALADLLRRRPGA